MQPDIGIRMTGEALLVRDVDAADHDMVAGRETMHVDTLSDADIAKTLQASSRSAAARSCAVVTFRFSSLPATMTGARPAASAIAASSVSTLPDGRPVSRQDRREMKALRRLRPPQKRAVDGFADHAVLDALDRVAERQSRDRGRHPIKRIDHPADQPGIRKRPRAVMDQHPVRTARRPAPPARAAPNPAAPAPPGTGGSSAARRSPQS